MLPLNFEFGVDETSCAMRGAVARDVGVYSVSLRGLLYDNQCIPRRKAEGGVRWRVIGLVREGALHVGEERTTLGPDAPFVGVDPMFAPVEEGGAAELRSSGSPFTLVAVRLRPELFVDPEPTRPEALRRASQATADRLRDLGDAADAGRTEAFAEGLRALAISLAEDGIVDRAALAGADGQSGADEPAVKRAGEAMFPVLFDLASRPMMVDLVDRAGVTERQMLRDIHRLQEDYDLFDRGWREAVVRWRVTAAAILLSAEKMTTAEIARLVGYASTTAMGRAFREAGLPSPREVRRRVLTGKTRQDEPE